MWLWILTACSRAPTARDMAYAVGLFDVVSQATVASSPGNHTVEPVVGSDPDDTPWQGEADLWLTTGATPSSGGPDPSRVHAWGAADVALRGDLRGELGGAGDDSPPLRTVF